MISTDGFKVDVFFLFLFLLYFLEHDVITVVDPKWKFAETIAVYGGLLMMKIAHQDLLPFDVGRLALKMEEWAAIDLPAYIEHMEDYGNCTFDVAHEAESGIEALESSIRHLRSAVKDFEDVYNETLHRINEDRSYELVDTISSINGVLRNVMKMFMHSDGIPSSKWHKSLLWDNGDSRFPYIWDLVAAGCEDNDEAALEIAFEITIEDAINQVSTLLSTV